MILLETLQFILIWWVSTFIEYAEYGTNPLDGGGGGSLDNYIYDN